MSTMTFKIEGDVNVQVTVTELDNGDLQFDLVVLDETGSIGDLNAIFFDVLDDSIVDGLTVSGDDITDDNFDANSVTKIDSYTNMSGEVVKEYGKFDGGVQFGTSGIGTDDIRETSFTLSYDSGDLSLDDVALQDFGVRLTSVGEEGGSREDSLKLGGTAPEAPVDPEPVDPAIATNDTLTVFDTEVADGFDFVSGGGGLLDNDTNADGTAYDGGIYQDGVAIDAPIIVAGSNGGLLTIYPDGSVDFDGNGAFDSLLALQTDTTDFTYEIDGGVTGTLSVTVVGTEDDGGLGGGLGGGVPIG